MPDAATIGRRIKEIRHEKGLTQAQFADLLGISTSTVAMYEVGERMPRDEIKKKIADAAGSKVDPIFFGDDNHE